MAAEDMVEPLMPDTADAPIDSATVAEGGATLLLIGGGALRSIAATRLRAACRCAHCVRARIDGLFPHDFDGVAIERLNPMGHYGVNIAFSDGHGRGIYPWAYLLELLKN
jgi:DUF971 family protein